MPSKQAVVNWLSSGDSDRFPTDLQRRCDFLSARGGTRDKLEHDVFSDPFWELQRNSINVLPTARVGT